MYISVIYHCRILARTLSFMLEPRFDLAWKEDLSDDSRALMVRRFMEVTETLGVLMMAGQPDWRHTDVGVVVVVTPNICKYLLCSSKLRAQGQGPKFRKLRELNDGTNPTRS